MKTTLNGCPAFSTMPVAHSSRDLRASSDLWRSGAPCSPPAAAAMRLAASRTEAATAWHSDSNLRLPIWTWFLVRSSSLRLSTRSLRAAEVDLRPSSPANSPSISNSTQYLNGDKRNSATALRRQ